MTRATHSGISVRWLTRAVSLVAIAATAACIAPGEGDEAEESAEPTDTSASALVDAPDARCAAAFAEADRLAIVAAINASNLAARERVSHALNRFGYGDRFAATALPTDTATNLGNAIYASLRAGSSIPAASRTAMDGALPNLARPAGDLHLQFRTLYRNRDAARAAGDATTAASLDAQITSLRDTTLEELAGKQVMAAALAPDIAIGEHLVNFWLNHFNVDGRTVAIWAPAYERTIRTSICGTFAELLENVTRTPAMLRYLDNYASTAPGTIHWSGATSINENHARELLELHTLGTGARTATNPSSPYVQADVVKVALLLTGWSYTYASDNRSTAFQFQQQYHAKGTKTVMGTVYPEGEAGGRGLLGKLATLPQAKRFICTKLAREFLASPPSQVVDACVAAWGTNGSLPRMYVSILSDPLTWKAAEYGNKVKNPLELVVSSHRLSADIGSTLTRSRVRSAVLKIRQMGQPLWRIDPPTGYSGQHLDWLDPGYINEQIQYVYGQSDPLGLKYGTASGLAAENEFAAMTTTAQQQLALARSTVIPTRSLSYPSTFGEA
ncbi:MAG: hypothetical protein K0S65_3727, partial [Labilithrix sp.]|nr:hypothetical protein [Labilithrix sp.]